MYTWIVFLHVAGAFGFLLAHGVSVAVLLRLRKERKRERITTLLDSTVAGGMQLRLYAEVQVLLMSRIVLGDHHDT